MQIHSTANYTDDRLRFVKQLEGDFAYVYLDTASPAIPTIGIGINVKQHTNLVLQLLGFDVAHTQLSGAAQIKEDDYINQIRAALRGSYAPGTTFPPAENNAVRTALDTILAARASDSAYSAFPNFVRTLNFKFSNPPITQTLFALVMEGYSDPLNGVAVKGYEDQLRRLRGRPCLLPHPPRN